MSHLRRDQVVDFAQAETENCPIRVSFLLQVFFSQFCYTLIFIYKQLGCQASALNIAYIFKVLWAQGCLMFAQQFTK